jgi:alpha,alpha-trehalase
MQDGVADKTLPTNLFDAVVFDLDGVITQTAKVHAVAWKAVFDDFLARNTTTGRQLAQFSIETDYYQYVDGKPRYEGVRSFLESRGIELPYGSPDDSCQQQTICGLGNQKNRLFLEKLRTEGVAVYDSSIAVIRKLQQAGIRIAVVSSSRNCQTVLKAAGIETLFNVRVDGVDLKKQRLAGKPKPDMFLEAARRLDSAPQRTAGIEDAVAGVQALRAADFGLVIGVNRPGQMKALHEHGADFVVTDLGELQVITTGEAKQLPSAFDYLDEVIPKENRMPALFLDYDGTLTPIVPHPNDAILSETMRETLKRLSGLCKVTVISGRDLGDVRERVGIKEIWYAGSHGFDIAGPGASHNEYKKGLKYLPTLDSAEQTLRTELADIPGCLVERKHFSVAIHYRQVANNQLEAVRKSVEKVHASHPNLRQSAGKKVFELQPDIGWKLFTLYTLVTM